MDPKKIITIIILIATGAFLFMAVLPRFEEVRDLRGKVVQKKKEAKETQDKLEATKKAILEFQGIEKRKIELIDLALPGNVDLPNLFVLVDSIISNSGFVTGNVAVSAGSGGEIEISRQSSITKGVVPGQTIGKSTKDITVSFSVSGRYESFIALLSDIERSIRIFDIQKAGLSSKGESVEANIIMKTYYK